MGQNPARRQKRLTKQKQKRQVRRTQLARQNSSDPTDLLVHVDRWPILETFVTESVWESGIGYGLIARRATGTKLAVGCFLIDTYCLGVKNCFWKLCTEEEYAGICRKLRSNSVLSAKSPELLSKLVHCAADYAQSFGFPPHVDFRFARLLLEDIDPSRCDDVLEFGQDGKPLYISGPNETPERARFIASRVQAAGGHFVMSVGEGPGELLRMTADSDDEDGDDDGEEDGGDEPAVSQENA